ncbi:MAG: hypothetical protein QOD60_2151 [Solirubrobacterales bacterium]|jgi:hypothetical protein|nr:hypothetical protein [Solirubrobacterales bacterium]
MLIVIGRSPARLATGLGELTSARPEVAIREIAETKPFLGYSYKQ